MVKLSYICLLGKQITFYIILYNFISAVDNASSPIETTLRKLLQKLNLKRQNSDMSESEQDSVEPQHLDKPKLDQYDSHGTIFDGKGLEAGDTDMVGMPYLPSRNADWLETSERADFYTAGYDSRENYDDNDDDDELDDRDMVDDDQDDDDKDEEYESIDEDYIF